MTVTNPIGTADVRSLVLRPVVTVLPSAAASLCALLSAGPEARDAMFDHVAQDSARLDLATNVAMSQLVRIPQRERPVAIRLAQSATMLGRHLLAVAQVAAHGNVGRIPATGVDLARAVLALTEQVAAVELAEVPAQRDCRPGRVTLPEARHQLVEASNRLDELMWQLTAAHGGVPR